MAEAKHSFVDDNPYLVYSPKAEMTYDDNSGGGGTGFPVVEFDDTTKKLNVTAGELVEMLEATPVFVNAIITFNNNTIETWIMFTRYITQGNIYGFFGLTIGDIATGGIVLVFSAETINDYPQYEEN